jgi:uncharacterized HAD superfamily protein
MTDKCVDESTERNFITIPRRIKTLIVSDIDGVICDFVFLMLAWLRTVKQCDVQESDITQYDLFTSVEASSVFQAHIAALELTPEQGHALCRQWSKEFWACMHKPGMHMHPPPYALAALSYNWLSAFAPIVLVTARLKRNYVETVNWLRQVNIHAHAVYCEPEIKPTIQEQKEGYPAEHKYAAKCNRMLAVIEQFAASEPDSPLFVHVLEDHATVLNELCTLIDASDYSYFDASYKHTLQSAGEQEGKAPVVIRPLLVARPWNKGVPLRTPVEYVNENTLYDVIMHTYRALEIPHVKDWSCACRNQLFDLNTPDIDILE